MGNRRLPVSALGFAALALFALASTLAAQQLTGNIFGNVTDEDGARLPGVAVTLIGGGAPQTFATDARGEFRFLNVPPGSRYTLTYDLDNWVKVTKTNVEVATGVNTQANAVLRLAKVEASVTVRGDAPLMETRKVGAIRTVSQVELQTIPTARDPWVLLQSSGVMVDRLNVGGNQSGQQSNFIAKGSGREQAVWNVDGVTITDMGALGASPAYYDFDSFEEIQFSTGGTDLAASTGGVQINLVTKRGTNDVHGSARVYLADDQWQSDNKPDEVTTPQGGNRVVEVLDYGIEAGGPIWTDRAWLWGAYGRNEIKLFTIGGAADNTTLEGITGKLNVQLFEGTSLTGFYNKDDKLKFGRDAGFFRPAETSYNQSGPAIIHKAEVSQVFSSRLFATATYAYVAGGFGLTPQAGTALDAFNDAAGVWHTSYSFYRTARPQHQAGTNGSFFFNTGPAGHELKFGFQYREAPVTSSSGWPGSQNVGYFDNAAPPPGTTTGNYARLTRGVTSGIFQEYYNAYVGDTITLSNLTLNVGVRYDLQHGNPEGASVLENSLRPDLLPAFDAPAGEQAFEWEDFSPRIGATYALGKDRKLVVKASAGRFVDQLGAGTIFHTNAAPGVSYLEYPWTDGTGGPRDNRVQLGEVDFDHRRNFSNLDPNNPSAVSVFNQTDPNLEAGKTDEIILGVDYEVMSDLVVGASYTYRKYQDPTRTRLIGLSRADFVPVTSEAILNAPANGLTGTLANGQTYDIRNQLYRLRTGLAIPRGRVLENRPDYEILYNGVDFSLAKRLSNRWMARLNAGFGSGEQELGFDACEDPNNVLNTTFGAACPVDQDIVARRSAGSGDFSGVFLHSRWQFNVAAMYELPWNFNIAMNLFGREGYPYPQWTVVNPADGLGNRNLLIGDLDDLRHDDVYNLDLRLGKVVNVGVLQVTLSADVFNVLNDDTVLQRNGRVNQSSYNTITEIQAPRILRLGARLSF
jgi:hypothetical protein